MWDAQYTCTISCIWITRHHTKLMQLTSHKKLRGCGLVLFWVLLHVCSFAWVSTIMITCHLYKLLAKRAYILIKDRLYIQMVTYDAVWRPILPNNCQENSSSMLACYKAKLEKSEKGQQLQGIEPRTLLAWAASALPLTYDSQTSNNRHNPLT